MNQQFVASRMPKLIVDLLEVIEIEIEDGELFMGASEPRECSLKALIEGQPIRQGRQFVSPDPPLGLDLCGDPRCDLRRMNKTPFSNTVM